jgi:hypothetical protein
VEVLLHGAKLVASIRFDNFKKLSNLVTIIFIYLTIINNPFNMKFFPYENFYILSNLKPVEVQLKLEQNISPTDQRVFELGNLFFGPKESFKGYSVNGVFQIEDNSIVGQKTYLPSIKGSTEAYQNGSRIHIRMVPRTFTILFMCIWEGLTLFICIVITTKLILQSKFDNGALIPYLMLILGYVMPTFRFKTECYLSTNILLRLFKGKIE